MSQFKDKTLVMEVFTTQIFSQNQLTETIKAVLFITFVFQLVKSCGSALTVGLIRAGSWHGGGRPRCCKSSKQNNKTKQKIR